MMDLVEITQKLWAREHLPILNGLLLADGRYFAVGHDVPESDVLTITPQILNVDPDYDYSAAVTLAETAWDNGMIYCGEGSFGGDGFVMVVSGNGDMRWLFMHEHANPFVNLQIENDMLYIQNNCLVTWRFSLKNPLDMSVDLTTGINWQPTANPD